MDTIYFMDEHIFMASFLQFVYLSKTCLVRKSVVDAEQSVNT